MQAPFTRTLTANLSGSGSGSLAGTGLVTGSRGGCLAGRSHSSLLVGRTSSKSGDFLGRCINCTGDLARIIPADRIPLISRLEENEVRPPALDNGARAVSFTG
ncbi:hypothetical protein E2C01_055179 [Portunus trituberculatus]|uniref:Uncharacterized protein n=1 Tax=Portunus trituberculatus TaxID=210409 RepID=A0A5B7GU45_PORTR|nr:hypothetical protein [Portunus trituberculatus]